MWIWYVSKAQGGSPARIASRARSRGVETVLIKAGDGGDNWSQFTPGLVADLKRRGLRVCAWQYVYGSDPVGEAPRRRGRRRRRRRLPRDRRRVGVRGPLRAGPHVRHPPAGGRRRRLPDRARRVPLRPLPPRLPLLGLPRPGRRPSSTCRRSTGRRSATASTGRWRPRTPTTASTGARSPRSASSTTTRRAARCAASARWRRRAASPAPRGGRGSTRQPAASARRPGAASAAPAATARAAPTRRWRREPRATSSSGPRSTWRRAGSSTPR